MGMNDDNERANDDDDEMKPNKQHKNYKLSRAYVCLSDCASRGTHSIPKTHIAHRRARNLHKII